tara:strand:+ start:2296 stop:3453 length:1158 start_codon:yes stop_codon:yes gene_type:complete
MLSGFLITSESAPEETRVAASPETVKKLTSLGCKVFIESGAGIASGFSDDSYKKFSGEIIPVGDKKTWGEVDVVLCVQSPTAEKLSNLKSGAWIAGLLSPYGNSGLLHSLKTHSLSALALELLPRISRAQSSDALSSQANIAGYKSVLLAASALDRYFPMLMTAAGTVQPAKVVILGAGVAGLQAVATAKRLGAVVHVSDIRPAVKEQVESLGARFISPPEMNNDKSEESEESGGYARQASSEFLAAQRKQLSDQLADADVAICTAQVPGKKAPKLISQEMLDRMRPGSVVIDLAVNQGGNCAETEIGKTVVRKGVKLIGASNLPCTVPNHASSLYARNLMSLFEPWIKDNKLILDIEDELIKGCLISQDGHITQNEIFNSGGKN